MDFQIECSPDDSIFLLPQDTVVEIFLCLGAAGTARCSMSCRRLNKISNDSRALWRHFANKDFGVFQRQHDDEANIDTVDWVTVYQYISSRLDSQEMVPLPARVVFSDDGSNYPGFPPENAFDPQKSAWCTNVEVDQNVDLVVELSTTSIVNQFIAQNGGTYYSCPLKEALVFASLEDPPNLQLTRKYNNEEGSKWVTDLIHRRSLNVVVHNDKETTIFGDGCWQGLDLLNKSLKSKEAKILKCSTVDPPASNPGGSQMWPLTREDSLFLEQVKMEFGDSSWIYNEFVELMKNFMAKQMDAMVIVARVSHLFRGYNKLIMGFNKLYADEFKIDVKDTESAGRDSHCCGDGLGEQQGQGRQQQQLPIAAFQFSPIYEKCIDTQVSFLCAPKVVRYIHFKLLSSTHLETEYDTNIDMLNLTVQGVELPHLQEMLQCSQSSNIVDHRTDPSYERLHKLRQTHYYYY